MKTDVLFVQPNQGEFVKKRIFQPGVEVPLNIACLASYLEREGINNQILDMRLYPDPYPILEKMLTEAKPSIIGIGSFTSEINNAKKVAKMAKKINPKVLTIIGGHHASAMPKDLLKESIDFDLLVYGEGEITLLEIIKNLKPGMDFSKVDGIAYRNGDEIILTKPRKTIDCLDDLPFPARDKLNLSFYTPSPGTGNYMTLPTTGIMASRGCPYKCSYCCKDVWGNTIRFRSPENVLSEIEHCIGKYGIHDFRFYDDVLTYPQWDLNSFCEQIISRKLNITWNCYSRVHLINEEKLRLMKASGCYHIKYGIEFGTEKALKLTKKGAGATLRQAKQTVELTKKVGIECKGNFMLGIPGENIQDCKKTISFAIELSPDLATFYPFDFFPGSEFFRRKLQGDKSMDDILPRKVTQELSNRAYVSFYFRTGYIIQRLKRMVKNPKREFRLVQNGLSMILQFFFGMWINKIRKHELPPTINN